MQGTPVGSVESIAAAVAAIIIAANGAIGAVGMSWRYGLLIPAPIGAYHLEPFKLIQPQASRLLIIHRFTLSFDVWQFPSKVTRHVRSVCAWTCKRAAVFELPWESTHQGIRFTGSM